MKIAEIFYRKQRQFFTEYGIILTIATIGGVIRYFMWDFMELKDSVQFFTALISFLFMSVAWEFFRGVNVMLNQKLPFEKSVANRIFIQLVIGILFMLAMRFAVFSYAVQFLNEPVSKIFTAATYAVYIILSFFINFIFFTIHFLGKWKEGLTKTAKLEQEKTQVQFDNLQNQLNPHFLFNALSSLDTLIHENQDLASQFLQNLSQVYRYVLRHKGKSTVSLAEEMKFIKDYIFLLKIRFQQAISIKINIDDKKLGMGIVPVTLQILLENSIKHNSIDADHPLIIEVYDIGNYLMIRNNKQPKKKIENSNQMGLKNLKSYYRFISESPVIIEETDVYFEVKIPLVH